MTVSKSRIFGAGAAVFACLVIWLSIANNSGSLPAFSPINLSATGQLFSSSSRLSQPTFSDQYSFTQQLSPIEKINLKGGIYWISGTLPDLNSDIPLSFVPRGSLMDRIDIWLMSDDQMVHRTTGYSQPHEKPLHYGTNLDISLDQPWQYWVRIESRYFSGRPTFTLMPEENFRQLQLQENLLTVGCLGALLVLCLYNLLIYFWVNDQSYFYYSLYLGITFVGWAAVFNVFADLVGWRHLSIIFLSFFLLITANITFYHYFLDLKKYHPQLARFSTMVAVASIIGALVHFSLQPWISYALINLLSTLWLSLGLYAGILRYRAGFKPARFFILAFSIMVIGGAVTVLPYFGLPDFVGNAYLVTLVCQTLDAIFLALALAERIRILREEKELATVKAMESDQKANLALTQANNTLLEANIKLHTALEISEEEKRRKDEFIITVSHELKTPLNSITASIDMLETGQAPEQLAQTINYLRYGVGRLSHQIQNIVMLAESEKNIQVQNRPFELIHLLSRLEHVAHTSLIDKHVRFEIKNMATVSNEYLGDIHLMYHMLSPVLENACIYTDEGNVTVTITYQSGHLLFEIEDTGHGMPQSKQTKIFDSFSQVNTGFSRQFEGLGLGLAVTNQIARILGTEISVDSQVNRGSVFRLSIPVSIADHISVKTQQQIQGKVLVVEDNQVNAKVLLAILEKLGIETELAEDGAKAVALFESGKYDLILMDLQMPEMDGFEATQKIRRLDVQIPIIAVTANADSNSRERCFQTGMTEILDKPVRLNQVQRTISQFLKESSEEL